MEGEVGGRGEARIGRYGGEAKVSGGTTGVSQV